MLLISVPAHPLGRQAVPKMVGCDLQSLRVEPAGRLDEDVFRSSHGLIADALSGSGDDTGLLVADIPSAEGGSRLGQLSQVPCHGDPLRPGRAGEPAAMAEPGGGADRAFAVADLPAIEDGQAARELGLDPIGGAAKLDQVLANTASGCSPTDSAAHPSRAVCRSAIPLTRHWVVETNICT